MPPNHEQSMSWLNAATLTGGLSQSMGTSLMVVTCLVLWTLYRITNNGLGRRLRSRKMLQRLGIPLMGDGGFIFGLYREVSARNICELLSNLHDRLGKYLGSYYSQDPIVVTIDLELIHKVFVTESINHVNQIDMAIDIIPPLAQGLFQMKDDQWRRARRSVNPLYTKTQVSSPLEVEERAESCRKLLAHIAAKPVNSKGERRVDVKHDFTAFIIDISFKKILDRHDMIKLEPGKRNEIVAKTERSVGTFFTPLVILYYLLELKLLGLIQPFTKLGSYCQMLGDLISRSMEMKRHNSTMERGTFTTNAPLSKVIDTLVPTNPSLRDVNPVHHLSFLMFASTETSSRIAIILFWYLAKRPEVQEKLREAIISEGEEATYLEWCIKETIRLYPPVPGFGRVLSRDVTTSAGKTFLKGVSIAVVPYTIHRSEEYWGPDADEFRPERFAEPLKHRLQFMGFGLGPRGCLGQQFAMKSLKEVTTHLLTRYRVEPTENTPNTLEWSTRNVTSILIDSHIELNFIEIPTAKN